MLRRLEMEEAGRETCSGRYAPSGLHLPFSAELGGKGVCLSRSAHAFRRLTALSTQGDDCSEGTDNP